MIELKEKLNLLLLFVVLASCGRKAPDLSSLRVGDYYVTQDKDCYVVLCVEKVTEKSLKGRWYIENGNMSKPHQFMAESGFWHKREMKSDSLIVKANAMPGGDTLVLDMLIGSNWETLSFVPWKRPSSMEIHRDYIYHDRLFNVAIDSNVVYAHAKGYWDTYPESQSDCDDYLAILMEKWLNRKEMTLKNLKLKMDVYTPKTNDATRRPLLMLIHGGAFFNGDKKDAGYEEWGRYFASRGYVVACINYRLGFKASGSKHVERAGYRAVQDARAAMCYLLCHPKRYPIDPNYLFVAGSSAGGITALNLAFMTDYDKPTSVNAGPLNKVYNNVSHLLPGIRKHKKKKCKDVGLEDLGGINAVAANNGDIVDFKINAVVNMWGAVHKIDMLDNSKSTAILSFHGDADSVVAYGYDYPFATIDMGPLKGILLNKMYGSKCIHEWASSYGMKSELHTKKGGGHSLHANCRELTDYYTLITDTTTRFLYLRMFPRPTLKKSHVGYQQWFELDNAGELQTCRWEAEGGLILEAKSDKARVLFLADAYEHKLNIIGQEKNGHGYFETYSIK